MTAVFEELADRSRAVSQLLVQHRMRESLKEIVAGSEPISYRCSESCTEVVTVSRYLIADLWCHSDANRSMRVVLPFAVLAMAMPTCISCNRGAVICTRRSGNRGLIGSTEHICTSGLSSSR